MTHARGGNVRPTTARVRQAIFSIVSHKIPGAAVLDLYAGTGAMGIEALSRGAAKAVFVESSFRQIRAIRDNLAATGFAEKSDIVKGDVLRTLTALGQQNRKFDLVIADPPYAVGQSAQNRMRLAEKTLQHLLKSGIVNPDSLIILEHAARGSGPNVPEGLTLLSVRKYGDTAVSILHSSPQQRATARRRSPSPTS